MFSPNLIGGLDRDVKTFIGDGIDIPRAPIDTRFTLRSKLSKKRKPLDKDQIMSTINTVEGSMGNLLLGLEYLRSLGFNWQGAQGLVPKWENGWLHIPCYYRSLPNKEANERLKALGFSWGITGMLRYPVQQGRI